MTNVNGISMIAKGLWKTVEDNSPAILTALSVTGVITTAVLSGKASFIAADDIALEENKSASEGYQKLPLKGRVLLVWKHYIPAMAVGAASVACIIGANTVHNRRAAALATAYSLTERAFGEYKDKVTEQIGVNKEQKVRDSIAKDHLDKNPSESSQVIITGGGDSLCYESMTGRYFHGNIEKIRKAQNDLNQQMLNEGYASQNDFFSLINLPRVSGGDDVGWNTDAMLDIQFSSHLTENTEPALHIGYRDLPIAKHYRIH